MAKEANPYSSKEYKENRLLVLKEWDYTCSVCGEYANTADHIIPVSHGGGHGKENLRAMCVKHNTSRGNRMEDRQERLDPELAAAIAAD